VYTHSLPSEAHPLPGELRLQAVISETEEHSAVGGEAAKKRVLLADDHALLRVGLRTLLATESTRLDIIEAGCLHDALELYRAQQPLDLVLLDLNMSDCRGLQGLRQFRDMFPDSRLAVLSATHDQFVVQQAEAMGAIAYIAKTHAPEVIVQLVMSLLRTDDEAGMVRTLGPTGTPVYGRKASYDRVAELGARHLEILDLVLFGCSNQEISNATGLSLGTVKNYVSTILLALDVRSRSHLISLFR